LHPLPDQATLAELDDVLTRVGLVPAIAPLELS
jgi:4-hydroxy-tetrahydrodipicolinate synthase